MAPHSFVARLAAAFASVLAISGATTRAATSFDGGLVLHPLRPRDVRSLLPRATEYTDQIDELSLQDKLQLTYGAPGDAQFHLADLTLYAPNGLQVISMEIFEGLTSAVDCKGDDGILSLTFKTQDVLDSAVEKWSWINENTDSTFIMIANHDGCGPDGERQAYTISEVEQVEGTLMTLLKAKATPWEEVAGSFDIEFKAVKAEAPIRRRLGRRGLFDGVGDFVKGIGNTISDAAGDVIGDTVKDVSDIVSDTVDAAGDVVDDTVDAVGDTVDAAGDVVDDTVDAAGDVVDDTVDAVGDAVDAAGDVVDDTVDAVGDAVGKAGDHTIEESISFDLAAGTPNQRTNILSDQVRPPRYNVDCVNCYSTARVELGGKLSVEDFIPTAFSLEASLSQFAVAMELEAVYLKNRVGPVAGVKPLNITKELFSAPIPGAGIEVPGIFKLGAVVSLDVGVSTSLSGTANLTFGATASLPQTAKVSLDLVEPDRSSQSGFDFDFDPTFQVNSASVGGSISAAITPKLSIGAEIVKFGKLETFVSLKTPEVLSSVKYAYNAADVCPNEPGTNNHGVQLDSNLRFTLNVGTNSFLGEGEGLPLWNRELLKYEKPLLTKCFPIKDPAGALSI